MTPDRAEIEAELECVLASRAFARSGRSRDLLAYLIRQHLDGAAHRIKELTIAIDVFGRGPGEYDSATDGIVRVSMTRLREALDRHYAEEGHDAPLRFEIPRGVYAPIVRRRAGVHLPQAPLVAVLPLSNFTNDPHLDALCDGLSEDLIDALTRVPTVRVIARTSSFRYKRSAQDIRDIARELGVDALLEGSVQLVGERLRVTAQLILGRDGTHLWSHAFEADPDERRALQAALIDVMTRSVGQQQAADRVVTALAQKPLPALAASLIDRARAVSAAQTIDGYKLAERYLEQACEIAPEHAECHGTLAGLMFSQRLSWLTDYDVPLERIRAPLARALEIDPEHPASLSLKGYDLAVHDHRWHEALALCRRAVALAPSSVILIQRLASVEMTFGAMDAAERGFLVSLEIDPFSPLGHYYLMLIAMLRGDVRTTERWLTQSRNRLGPLAIFDNADLAGKVLRREWDAALAHGEALLRREPQMPAFALRVGQALAGLGRYDEARERIFPLLDRANICHRGYLRAAVAVCGGHRDDFFSEIGRAVDDQCSNLLMLPIDPLFAPVHDDARWSALMQRIQRQAESPFLPL